MLFLNPHLPFFGAFQWYEGHVYSDEGWDMSGVSMFGHPFPVTGHNAHLGWTHTVNSPDVGDLYLETFDVMIHTICIIALLFGALACRADAQKTAPAAAEPWPGKMPNEERAKLRPLYDEFLKAMRAGDDAKLRTTREAISKAMGKYVGVSEDSPTYAQPIDAAQPDLKKVEALWRASFQRMQGRHGWEVAAAAKAQGHPQPRLRISFRAARAYLQSYEAGLTGKEEFLKYERSGFDYIANQQAGKGGFNMDVNFLCDQFLPELEKRNEPMTETMANYLLYRRVKAGQAKACELEMPKCKAVKQ